MKWEIEFEDVRLAFKYLAYCELEPDQQQENATRESIEILREWLSQLEKQLSPKQLELWGDDG